MENLFCFGLRFVYLLNIRNGVFLVQTEMIENFIIATKNKTKESVCDVRPGIVFLFYFFFYFGWRDIWEYNTSI